MCICVECIWFYAVIIKLQCFFSFHHHTISLEVLGLATIVNNIDSKFRQFFDFLLLNLLITIMNCCFKLKDINILVKYVQLSFPK